MTWKIAYHAPMSAVARDSYRRDARRYLYTSQRPSMALDTSAAPGASGHAPEKRTTIAKLIARSEKSSAGGGPSGSRAWLGLG